MDPNAIVFIGICLCGFLSIIFAIISYLMGLFDDLLGSEDGSGGVTRWAMVISP